MKTTKNEVSLADRYEGVRLIVEAIRRKEKLYERELMTELDNLMDVKSSFYDTDKAREKRRLSETMGFVVINIADLCRKQNAEIERLSILYTSELGALEEMTAEKMNALKI